MAHAKYPSIEQDAESTKSDKNSDLDNEKIVVENKYAKKVSYMQSNNNCATFSTFVFVFWAIFHFNFDSPLP